MVSRFNSDGRAAVAAVVSASSPVEVLRRESRDFAFRIVSTAILLVIALFIIRAMAERYRVVQQFRRAEAGALPPHVLAAPAEPASRH